MISLSWIDFYYIIKESEGKLIGARIDSFYGNHDELHIKFYKAGQKNLFLSSFISKGITILNNSKSQHNPKNGFIQYLRKYADNGFIDEITSYEKERIITLKISKKNKEEDSARIYYLHLEHFMGGQIHFCDENQKILKSLKSVPNELRKKEYQLPQKEFSILENIELDFNKNLQDALKPYGLGKKYVNLISNLFSIDNSKLLNEYPKDSHSQILSFLSKLLSHELSPVLFHSEIYPFFVENSEPCDRLYCEQLFLKYSSQLSSIIEEKESQKMIRLKKRLQEQEAHMKKNEKECDTLQQKGSIFYEEYGTLQEFQQKVKEIVEKDGFKGLKQKIKENPKLKEIITQVNEKEQKVSINVDKLIHR